MDKVINDAEFRAVSSLNPKKRYDYCVKWIADSGQIWTLKAPDGFVLSTDNITEEVIPIWPYKEFAQACAILWEGSLPFSIDLSVWLDRWIPGIERDARKIGVFPVLTDENIVVSPETFKTDILHELENYE